MIHPSKVLNSLSLRALKSFGQNFLVSQSCLVSLEKHFDPEKPVLEIGPGLGAITEYLINKQFKVIAIEKDPLLAEYLRNEFHDKIKVENTDFLELTPSFFRENQITQIMGNLPFYITSDIIVKVIKETNADIFVMGIQKEVGERLLKESGNSLALFVKANGDILDHRVISKNNFYPVPDVSGIWVTWKRNKKIENMNMFEVFLRGIFWGKRKNFLNALLKNPFFQEVPETQGWHKNILQMHDELSKLRADQLTFEDIRQIFSRISRDSETP